MDKLKKIFGKILCYLGIHSWSPWEPDNMPAYSYGDNITQYLERYDHWIDVIKRQCNRCNKEVKKTKDSGHY